MAKVLFKLKEPKSISETLIYATFYFEYDRLKYSTREKILPKYWNEEEMRVRLDIPLKQTPIFHLIQTPHFELSFLD